MKILELLTKQRITGNIGENMAAKFLKQNKYKIIERNYVALGNEIDIIASGDGHLVFIEVKSRTVGHESPMESRPASSVDTEKQRAIIKVAEYYCSFLLEKPRIRFDVIEVYLKENKTLDRIEHLIGAFTKNTAYRKYY